MSDMKVAIHRDILVVDGTIRDPARDMIYDEFPSILLYSDPCAKCHGLKIDGQNYCSDCFGIGREIKANRHDTRDPKSLCEEARIRKIMEVPDEVVTCRLQRLRGTLEFTLTSIYTAFHVGTPEERILDHSKWEKRIRSIPTRSSRG